MNKKAIKDWLLLGLGVIYPTGVIVFEWISRFCASAFFDPLPSMGHLLLVLLVPAANGLVWWQLRGKRRLPLNGLRWLSLVAIGVAIYYSLVFLPLAPFAVVAIVFYGIGLLPLAPMVALVAALVLYRRFYQRYEQELSPTMRWWKGAGISLLLLVLLDVPGAATTWGMKLASSPDVKDRQFGTTLLRTVGDEELMLRMCYDGSRQVLGPWTLVSILVGRSPGGPNQTEAREIFYRVTGQPFNTLPVPYRGGNWSRFDEFQFDSDLGGVQVGGRIRDLRLLSSRMDGSVDGDQGVAYMEWILEFQNDSTMQREARVEIALPPDSVVSRASLWIDGEEREAAFAKQSQVRAAYQRVVSRRRDPLLVTSAGPDRILAQAFPIPARGGTIKFKLGITAPLTSMSSAEGNLILPAIADRNFNIGEDLKHALWFEGEHPLLGPQQQASTALQDGNFRWQAQVSDRELSLQRITLASQRKAEVSAGRGTLNKVSIEQRFAEVAREPADAALIVIDGSASLAEHVTAIEQSLARIPAGLAVGFILASDSDQLIDIAPWDDAQKNRVKELFQGRNFKGGQDNALALARSITELERFQRPLVIWLHGSQPVTFSDSGALLEQTVERSQKLPELLLLNLQAGPNLVLKNSYWQWWARNWPYTGDTQSALEQIFARYLNAEPQHQFIRERRETDFETEPKESPHLVRLWANERIKNLMRAGEENSAEALNLANEFKLVTPLSGAVVLENAAQYAENDLTPVDAGSVPTIPEPEQWALIITLLLIMLWLFKTQRARFI